MADNPITGVLSLLRLFKQDGLAPGNSVFDHVRRWCGDQATDVDVARLMLYGGGVALAADAHIRASPWDDEAKQGLLHVTSNLQQAFSPVGCGQPIANYLPTLDSAITMFAILSSAAGLPSAGPAPAELNDLLAEIAALIQVIDGAGLDPLVHRTAKEHLRALETLLRNVDAFGVDAALVAYFELIARLRRVERTATPATKEVLAKIWPEVERWAGRLAIIEEAINNGHGLLEHAGSAIKLLAGG